MSRPSDHDGPSIFGEPLPDFEEPATERPEPTKQPSEPPRKPPSGPGREVVLGEAEIRPKRPFWIKVIYLLIVLVAILIVIFTYALLQRSNQTPIPANPAISRDVSREEILNRLEMLEQRVQDLEEEAAR